MVVSADIDGTDEAAHKGRHKNEGGKQNGRLGGRSIACRMVGCGVGRRGDVKQAEGRLGQLEESVLWMNNLTHIPRHLLHTVPAETLQTKNRP